MEKITLYAKAKINLGLDILRRRPDGYHDIKTLMHTITLKDELTFEKAEYTSILCQKEDVPCDESNIVIKCARALEEVAKKPLSTRINLIKEIPTKAGLGGGSADGASTLKALNILYELNYTDAALAEVGKRVGADIPFLVHGGFALCEGIGEVITPIKESFSLPCLLIKPDVAVNTKAAYDFSDNTDNKANCDFPEILRCLKTGEACEARNDFEEYMKAFYPSSLSIKARLKGNGAFIAGLSGSGSCFYGLFKDEAQAAGAKAAFEGQYPFVHLARLSGND